MSERKVQEIFNLAIRGGFYAIDSTVSSSKRMCVSLVIMHRRSLLSDDEYLKASEEIKGYLSHLQLKTGKDFDCLFLHDALVKLGVLSKRLSRQETWEFLVSVYSDWDNRPLI